eukprot:1351284-Pleurochrysis_carterae.AAC.1
MRAQAGVACALAPSRAHTIGHVRARMRTRGSVLLRLHNSPARSNTRPRRTVDACKRAYADWRERVVKREREREFHDRVVERARESESFMTELSSARERARVL